MHKSILYLISFSLVLLLTTANAYSEPVSATLDALVAEVVENNPELKFYQAEVEAAKGSRRAVGLLSNPELSGSIGQKRVWSEEDEVTGKGEAGEISLMQTFEWPGRIGLKQAIANENIKLAEAGLKQFSTSLAARARIAAYELVSSLDKAAAADEVASHFNSLREVQAGREPAGLTPLLEMRVVEAMALNMQRKSSEASLAAKRALFELNQMRGASPDTELALNQIQLTFKALEDKKPLIELAKSNDFLVQIRALELSQKDLEVGLAESERLPAISVGPSFSQETAGERERVMAVAVSMPLPVWNQNQGNIQVAKAHRSQAEVSLDMARRDAERRLLESAAIYETKVKEMQNWQPDSIQHFKEAAELADRHYRLGSVPVSVYLDIQTQYLDAMAALHDTKKEALEAAAQLELLTGNKLSLTQETK